MSTTVDNRVVEMQFKNADFERGVKETITSLNDLQKALEINTNSVNMSRIQKEVDSLNLSKVTEAVEALSSRFSNLGIVGMTVMQNLTNKAIGFVEHLGQISIGQILTGGKGRAQKVADARFKLEGLMSDFEDSGKRVEQVFTSASDAVNDTAFGLDEAANIAAMLTGSGVDYERAADGVSDLDTALRGIAGAAAMSNSSFEDIGRIFAQVKTAGRLMGQDMMQLQGRTINVVAELSKYLKKSQAEVQEMVHKGQIDFNTFAAAMDNSFGAQAKKSNETLQGVLANVRAALSRMGEIFYSGIIENKELIKFFGDLKSKLNEIKGVMEPLREPFKKVVSSISKLGSALLGLFGIQTSKPIEKFIDFLVAGLNKISNFIDAVTKKVSGFADKMGLNKAVEETKETVEKISEISQEIKDIAHDIWFGDETGKNPYGNGKTRIAALGEDMYNKVQPYVNAMKEANFDLEKADQIYAATVTEDSEQVVDAKEKERKAYEDAIKAKNEASDQKKDTEESMKIFDGLRSILTNILKITKSVGKAFKNTFSFKGFKSSLKDITSKFIDFISVFKITDERAAMLQTAFEGLFGVFKMVGDTIGMLIGSGFSILAKILPTIIDGFYKLGNFIGSALKKLRDFVESNNLLVRAGRFIVSTFEKVSSTLKEFFSRFVQLPAVQKLKEELIDIYERVGAKLLEFFGKAKDSVGGFFGSISEGDGSTMDRILGGINDALEEFMDLTDKGSGKIKGFFDKFKEGGELEDTGKKLEEMSASFTNLKKQGKSLKDSKSIGEFINNMRTATGMSGGGGGKPKEFVNNITNSFKKLDTAKLALLGVSGALITFTATASYAAINLSDAIANFGAMAKAITSVPKAITGVLGEVKLYMQRKSLAKVITQLAIALAVLAVSLAALTLVDADKLRNAGETIALIFGVMTAMVAVLGLIAKQYKKTKDFNNVMTAFSLTLVAFAGSVLMLAGALAILSTIKWNKDAFISLGVLVGIMAVLIGVIAAINKLGPEIKTTGIWLIFYAGSVFLLAEALNRLSQLNVENLKTKLLVIGSAMLLVAAIAAASSKMSFGAGVGVMSIIGSIILLELALKWIIKYGVKPEDIIQSLDSIFTVVGALGLLTLYIVAVSLMARKCQSTVSTLILIIASVALISFALSKLSKIPAGDLWTAGIVLTMVLAAMMTLIYVIGEIAQANRIKQAGTMLVKLSGALAIISLVIAFLGTIPEEVLDQGMKAVAKIAVILGILIWATGFAGKIDAKTFLAMAGAMAVLALIVTLMSFIEDKDSLVVAMLIFAGALASFGLAMFLACKNAKKNDYKPLLAMVSVMLVLAGSLIALTILNKGDYMTMLSAAGSLALVLIALGECARIMMSAFNVKGVGPAAMKQINTTILIMMGVIGAVGIALSAVLHFANGDWRTALAAGGAMALVIGALAGVYFALSKIPKTGKEMVKRAGALALISVALIPAAAALSALSKFGIEKSIPAAIALAVVIGAITAALAVLMKFSESGVGFGLILAIAAAISGVAIALGFFAKLIAKSIDIVVNAITKLAKVPYDKIDIGKLMALAGVFLTFSIVSIVAGAGLVAIGVGLATIAGAIATVIGALSLLVLTITPLGVITLAVSKSLNTLIETIERMSKSASSVANGIRLIGKALSGAIGDVGAGLGLGFAKFILSIQVNAILIGNALKNLVLTAIDILMSAKLEITAKILEGLTDMFKMLEQKLPALFEHMNKVIILCLAFLASNAATYGEFGAIIASEFAIGMAKGLAQEADRLVDTAVYLALKVIKAIKNTFDNYKDIMSERVESAYSKASAYVWKGMAAMAINPIDKKIAEEQVAFLEQNSKAVKDSYTTLDDELAAYEAREAERRGEEKAQAEVDGMTKGYRSADTTEAEAASGSVTDKIMGAVNTGVEKGKGVIKGLIGELKGTAIEETDKGTEELGRIVYKDMSGLSEDVIRGLKAEGWQEGWKDGFLGKYIEDGLEEDYKHIKQSVQNVPDEVQKEMEKQGWKYNADGTQMWKDIKTGFETESENSDLTGVFTGAFDKDGVSQVYKSNGSDMFDDYISGMETSANNKENQSKVYDLGAMYGNLVYQGGKSKEGLDVNSPSKKGIALGDSWFEGLVLSLESMSNLNTIKQASIAVANGVVSSFSSALDSSSSMDILQPTIAPVLDDSNMQRYSGVLNTLTNPSTMKLAADSTLSVQNSDQARMAQQIEMLSKEVNALANKDFSKDFEKVQFNVNANTMVDGKVLRKTSAAYTIDQIDRKERAIIMAKGGRA